MVLKLCTFVTNLWILVPGFGRMHFSFPLRGLTVVSTVVPQDGSIEMKRTYIEFTWTCAHLMMKRMFFLPALLSSLDITFKVTRECLHLKKDIQQVIILLYQVIMFSSNYIVYILNYTYIVSYGVREVYTWSVFWANNLILYNVSNLSFSSFFPKKNSVH